MHESWQVSGHSHADLLTPVSVRSAVCCCSNQFKVDRLTVWVKVGWGFQVSSWYHGMRLMYTTLYNSL